MDGTIVVDQGLEITSLEVDGEVEVDLDLTLVVAGLEAEIVDVVDMAVVNKKALETQAEEGSVVEVVRWKDLETHLEVVVAVGLQVQHQWMDSEHNSKVLEHHKQPHLPVNHHQPMAHLWCTTTGWPTLPHHHLNEHWHYSNLTSMV